MMGWMWRKNKNNYQGTEMVIFTEMGKMSRFGETCKGHTVIFLPYFQVLGNISALG